LGTPKLICRLLTSESYFRIKMKGGLFLLFLVLILATFLYAEMQPTNGILHCNPSPYVDGQLTNVVDGNQLRFEQIEARLKAIEEALSTIVRWSLRTRNE
jgi:hypothetical protein